MTALNPIPAAAAPVNYDPYSPEAMDDPRELYAQLRAAGPIHYLPAYNAWALASFEAVWQVTRDSENFTYIHGMPPASALLGEPIQTSFTSVPDDEYHARRRVLLGGFGRAAADRDEPYLRRLAQTALGELRAHGDGRIDALRDYTSRVTKHYVAYKAGVPHSDAFRIRGLTDGFLAREPGQKGSSEVNMASAAEVGAYLHDLVAKARRDRSLAHNSLGALLDATFDDRPPLTDDEIVGDLFTILITGSDTTETASAATLYYLAQHPGQLADVRADPSLIPSAFAETLRYDHPTDILCCEVLNEVEVCGQTLRPGQPVIMMWGSAGLDEAEFADAAVFDIHRRCRRNLIFGQGYHRCLGENIAMRMGTVILEEFFAAVDAYEVDFAACTRRYAEFVKGFDSVPMTISHTTP